MAFCKEKQKVEKTKKGDKSLKIYGRVNTVFRAALVNGDLCRGLCMIKDAITAANLDCRVNIVRLNTL